MPPPPEEEEDEKDPFFDNNPDFHKAFNRPKMVSREEWGARPATGAEPLKHPVKNVRFTYTGTSQCSEMDDCAAILQKIQRDDMEKSGLSDIRYNFLIGGERAYFFEGRGWKNDAHRPKKHDDIKGDCIDIAFIGNFKVDFPTFQCEVGALNLVKMGQGEGYITKDQNPVCHSFRDAFLNRVYTFPKDHTALTYDD